MITSEPTHFLGLSRLSLRLVIYDWKLQHGEEHVEGRNGGKVVEFYHLIYLILKLNEWVNVSKSNSRKGHLSYNRYSRGRGAYLKEEIF